MKKSRTYLVPKILACGMSTEVTAMTLNKLPYPLTSKTSLKDLIIAISQEEPERTAVHDFFQIFKSLDIPAILDKEDILEIVNRSRTNTFTTLIINNYFSDKASARFLLTNLQDTFGNKTFTHHGILSYLFFANYMLPPEEFEQARDTFYATYSVLRCEGSPLDDNWRSKTGRRLNGHVAAAQSLLWYVLSRCTAEDAHAFFSSIDYSVSLKILHELYEYNNNMMTKRLDLSWEYCIPKFIKETFGYDLTVIPM